VGMTTGLASASPDSSTAGRLDSTSAPLLAIAAPVSVQVHPSVLATSGDVDTPPHVVAGAGGTGSSGGHHGDAVRALSDGHTSMLTILRTMTLATKSVQRLLDSFLTIERIEAGMFSVELIPFGPRKLVQMAQLQLATNATQARLAMRVDVAPDVPLTVLGDFHRLLQVRVV